MKKLVRESLNESRYYDGYQEANYVVQKMSEQELLDHIDGLEGRDNLPKNYTLEQLRQEAIEQTRKDFLTPEGKQMEQERSAYIKALRGQK